MVVEMLAQTARGHSDDTKVFISYSRTNRAVIERLVAALEKHKNIVVFLDVDDILPTEEWRQRLGQLIIEADTIVFCLSPESLASEVCAWEIGCAESLNKRVAPIVVKPFSQAVPDWLAKLNYIFFTDPAAFDVSVEALVTALQTDIGWIREHTRIGGLAERWFQKRTRDQLLRGNELAQAESWVRGRPLSAPEPTAATTAFLGASRANAVVEKRAQRRIVLALLLLAAAAVTVGVGWWKEQPLREAVHWQLVMQPTLASKNDEAKFAATPGASFKECRVGCPEMIVVPTGAFTMGSLDSEGEARERPQRAVSIMRPIAIGKFEVTFAEWDHCAGFGGDCRSDIAAGVWGRGQQPVINVTWGDAQTYVTWLSRQTGARYRLLSESEWEYAARAGSEAFFFVY